MDPVELYNLLAPQPFRPVRVHLKDGRTYDIQSRQLAIVGVSWLDIGIPLPHEKRPIYDHVVRVWLNEIGKVEYLPASSSSAGG